LRPGNRGIKKLTERRCNKALGLKENRLKEIILTEAYRPMKVDEGKKRVTVLDGQSASAVGPVLPSLLPSAIAVVAFALGARDVQLSAKAMLERVG
jgi:hypothetical protein